MVPKPPIRNFDFYQLEDRVLLNADCVDLEIQPQDIVDVFGANDNGMDKAIDLFADADGQVVATGPNPPAESNETVDDLPPPSQTDDTNASGELPTLRLEVIFIDDAVVDAEQLLQGLRANRTDVEWKIFQLDGTRNGIDQISQSLSGLSDVDAIHLISSGDGTNVRLGQVELTTQSTAAYAGDLARWADALGTAAELHLYGCDLSNTADGRTLSAAIATLCQCEVTTWDVDQDHDSIQSDDIESGMIELDFDKTSDSSQDDD